MAVCYHPGAFPPQDLDWPRLIPALLNIAEGREAF